VCFRVVLELTVQRARFIQISLIIPVSCTRYISVSRVAGSALPSWDDVTSVSVQLLCLCTSAG